MDMLCLVKVFRQRKKAKNDPVRHSFLESTFHCVNYIFHLRECEFKNVIRTHIESRLRGASGTAHKQDEV